jgi:hypothetical protein
MRTIQDTKPYEHLFLCKSFEVGRAKKNYKNQNMDNYIFLSAEGYTFQPNSNDETPDIENLQVIGFSNGSTADEAFENLLSTHTYLKETSFGSIFCYKLDKHYEESRREFDLKAPSDL